MSCTLGCNSLINNGKINNVLNCVNTDEIAAPDAPKIGIKHRFKITLHRADPKYRYFKYFCFFSHIIQVSLATPRYEKATIHTTIRNGPTAGK